MDTDDLSNEAYKAIISEAAILSHNLTLQFGVLSASCKNELEYLNKSLNLTREIMKLDYSELEELLFGEVPDGVSLKITLEKIVENIEFVKKIPTSKLHYEF